MIHRNFQGIHEPESFGPSAPGPFRRALFKDALTESMTPEGSGAGFGPIGSSGCWKPKFQSELRHVSGWWLAGPPRPEKYDFVNWDDEIPKIWENKKWQPNHQPGFESNLF